MTANGDDLTPVADAIRASLEERGLSVFPAMPVIDDDNLAMGHVYWRDDDWQGLLDIAQRVEVRLVYLQVNEFDQDDIDGFAGDDDTCTPELTRAVNNSRRYIGAVLGLRVGFAYHGILHEWRCVTPWYEQLMDLADEADDADTVTDLDEVPSWLDRRREPTADHQLIMDNTEAWARTISEDRRFIEGLNAPARSEIAVEIVPELAAFLASDGTYEGSRSWRLATDVIRQSELRLRSEVKPRIEADVEARVDELASALSATDAYREARTKDERRRVAAAFIENECGYRITRLTDVLLRRADERRG